MSKERIGLMDSNSRAAETGSKGADETEMSGGFAESVEQKMDAVRDWFSAHCCGFISEIPSMLFLIFLCLFLALLLSLVPLLFLLFGPVARESQPIVDLQVLRAGHKFPVPDRIDSSSIPQGDTEDEYGGIPFMQYFPTSVSDCVGFGFSCTNDPHIVISSSLRCNGKVDCKDESDENFCLTCQSPFSCPLSLDNSTKNLICLNAAQLCDGISHCPNKFDETFYCRSECQEDEHKCGGQDLCLPQEALCNGINDCKDGSDEKNCEVCIQGAKMCNGKCVAVSKLCDGKNDCEDASDEKNCDCRACSSSEVVLCDDGTCLSRDRVCDGRPDCSNSMDEQNCPGSCVDIKETEMVRCSDSRLYPLGEACRGELPQCVSSCTDCHPTAAFTCHKEHRCIQQSMVCNGIADCVDGEDERDCDKVCALENSFKCARSNKDKCIPAEQRCDGIWHCEDKSDEMNCRECPSENTFACGSNCHPNWVRCDGFAHCADGSDELNCSCQDCLGYHSNTYMCHMTERCMRRDEACLPYSTCPNATAVDKAYCARLALPSFFFS